MGLSVLIALGGRNSEGMLSLRKIWRAVLFVLLKKSTLGAREPDRDKSPLRHTTSVASCSTARRKYARPCYFGPIGAWWIFEFADFYRCHNVVLSSLTR